MTNVLILTGGSRGIGKTTLTYFQEQGWEIISLSRTPSQLKGDHYLPIDLANWQHLNNNLTFPPLIEKADKICLVHNAAYYQRDNVSTLSADNLALTLATNVIAPAILNTMVIPYMKPDSSIIYIGSTLAEKAVPNSASYVTSKHALIGLMRSTCQDLIGKLIHTCCICPGLVDTEMLRDTRNPSQVEQFVKEKVIAGRLIDPIEIAKTIYFCANSPVINGTVLHANLGQVAD